MRYRRSNTQGATWFFTVNLADRKADLLVRHIDILRSSLRKVKAAHPFEIVAMVVLPDHLHAIWHLPAGDADYPMRWSLIKAGFSRCLPKTEMIRASREAKRERGVWQRRYWEHQIRDEEDLARHVDYIHINPVKHGYVARAGDWPHSSIHRFIAQVWWRRIGGRRLMRAIGWACAEWAWCVGLQCIQPNLCGWLRWRAMNVTDYGHPWGELAIRFAASIPGVSSAIVGTANPANLAQSIEWFRAGALPGYWIGGLRAAFVQHDRDWRRQL